MAQVVSIIVADTKRHNSLDGRSRLWYNLIMSKRVWDRIDQQAEKEAGEVYKHSRTICKPFGYNKQTHKNRAARSAADAFIECKTIKNYYTTSL